MYVWQAEVGAAWLEDRAAFGRPADVRDFKCTNSYGAEVCVAADMGARRIRVERSRWPLGGVRVYVDGKRWGRRGEVGGGG